MSSNIQPASSDVGAASTGMRGEIARKWGKFDANEIANLKTIDDLVTQVASKYGLDAKQAQKEVETVAKGRQL